MGKMLRNGLAREAGDTRVPISLCLPPTERESRCIGLSGPNRNNVQGQSSARIAGLGCIEAIRLGERWRQLAAGSTRTCCSFAVALRKYGPAKSMTSWGRQAGENPARPVTKDVGPFLRASPITWRPSVHDVLDIIIAEMT